MKNKFFILFILIFVFSSSIVFGGSIPDMTDEMAEYIYEFYTNPDHLVVSSNSSFTTDIATNSINILNTISSGDIKNFFNTKFKNAVIKSELNIDYKNITLYGYYRKSSSSSDPTFRIIIIISNNTYPNNNDLAFQDYYYFISSSRLGSSQNNLYFTNMTIDYRGNISNISSLNTGPYFELYPGIEPTFNADETIMYVPFQLALSDYQECYYNNKAYIIGNRIQTEITPPSGDSGSGDTGGGTTPSGDTPGTTPNYNEKLDNIQTGINNIENKIPTSGEVQEVISGTLNEAFGEGSGEVTSEQINNLQEDVNEIMGDIVPANNFISMFNQIISAFSEALLGQGEETIKFEHRGENYVISSNQVNLPIAEIKGFLSVFFNVAIVMAMALTISWIIRRMEEGDLISVLHMGDADMYFYEDLNLF